MDCPHCGKAFHDTWNETIISGESQMLAARLASVNRRFPDYFIWKARLTDCPACNKSTIELARVVCSEIKEHNIIEFLRAYPKNAFRKPTPPEVPTEIKEDYEEACKVLPDSAKASAALSRRCLQAILQGQGYSQKNLAKQIDALLDEADPAKVIPTPLRTTVDAIRNFGNFSAHPLTDQTTLQIIPVEKEEAEWCLEILEEMFDHYYVKPAAASARIAALNAKNTAAGKPPTK